VFGFHVIYVILSGFHTHNIDPLMFLVERLRVFCEVGNYVSNICS
jgi:hypothetical protein